KRCGPATRSTRSSIPCGFPPTCRSTQPPCRPSRPCPSTPAASGFRASASAWNGSTKTEIRSTWALAPETRGCWHFDPLRAAELFLFSCVFLVSLLIFQSAQPARFLCLVRAPRHVGALMCQEANSLDPELERQRAYLRILARKHLHRRLWSRIDPSDVVQ